MRQKIVMTKSRLNLEEKYGETLERCREPCYSYILLVISGRGGLQLLIYNWEIGKGMELTCKDGSCRRKKEINVIWIERHHVLASLSSQFQSHTRNTNMVLWKRKQRL